MARQLPSGELNPAHPADAIIIDDEALEELPNAVSPWSSGDASDHPTRVEGPARGAQPKARARVLTPPPLPPPPQSQFPRSGVRTTQRDDTVREGDMLAGKYLVERLIGKTGPAVVACVRHVELGQRVLLKFLSHEACAYPDTVARFLQGARAAQQLTSSHTVRTLDAGRLGSGLPYLVTEYLEGSSLREMLKVTGGLAIGEAVDWILQATISVAEAHRYGMVHGNLNPSTLFVADAPDGAPLIKVADFGVADALRTDPLGSPELRSEALTADGANRIVESLACKAPEQVRRASDVDLRTDVWALGAVLHEMLTGFPAYHADTVPGILAMIVADPAPPVTTFRSDVPAALERVLLRCLERERGARFASVAELAAALKPFASDEGQALADRVTRTLGRTSPRAAGTSAASRAIVRVNTPTPSGPPAPAPTAATAPAPSSPAISWGQRYQMVWSAALVACGLVGGMVGGSLIAARSTPTVIVTSATTAQPTGENRVDIAAARPAAEAVPPATVAVAQAPASMPAPVAAPQAPVATTQTVAPAGAQPARPAFRPAPPARPQFRRVEEIAAAPAATADTSKSADADGAKPEAPKTAAASKTLFDDMR